MSEKLFTLDDEENGLCRCILVDGEEIPTCEICDLLNKLYEENERLLRLNKRLNKTISIKQSRINELEKKNVELQKKNTKLIAKIDFLERVIDGDV